MSIYRINKIVSYYDFSSKRSAENKLLENVLTTEFGKEINPDTMTRYLNLKNLKIFNFSSETLLINSPMLFLSTGNNIQTLKVILDFFLNKYKKRFFPRRAAYYLRRETILVNNDGAISNKLEPSKFDYKKVYIVKISNLIEARKLIICRNGINLRNKLIDHFSIIINKNILENKILKGIFKEKINTQIRRISGLLGFKILNLISVSFEKISLENLKESHLRLFNKSVFEYLR